MGGVGSGGRRRGAGRKAMSPERRFVTGDAGNHGAVLLQHPSAPPPPPLPLPVLDEADAPNELTMEERHVWLELAPHAMQAGTLVPGTQAAFVTWCRWVLLERQFAVSVLEKGSAKHVQAAKEAKAGYYDFGLRPTGKPMPQAEQAKPVSKLSRFMTS